LHKELLIQKQVYIYRKYVLKWYSLNHSINVSIQHIIFKLEKYSYGTQLYSTSHYYYGNQKSIKSNIFCLFQRLWNVHKPNFMLIQWAIPKLLGQKNSTLILGHNLSLGQNFLQHIFFLFIDILLKLQQQILTCFCKFSWNFMIILDFFQLLT